MKYMVNVIIQLDSFKYKKGSKRWENCKARERAQGESFLTFEVKSMI